ncbi:PREDICTED: non-specific lipid-transfer protein-like [Nicotiana attenuata]|nr:PREDICTED: non-specific lipid-transfer protein-like [Nicotiana attenuata]
MVKIFYTLIILLLVLAAAAMAKPSCNIVSKRLVPCYSYIKGKYHSIKPSNRCCRGLNDIADMVKNGEEGPIAVCLCIKGALLHVRYDPTRITLASQQCHTRLSLPPVGHNTVCSRSSFDRADVV